jgi:hypothetical protein
LIFSFGGLTLPWGWGVDLFIWGVGELIYSFGGLGG